MLNKYPLKLIPYCKEVIWGGKKLKKDYGKQCDFDDLGETWELSAFPGKESVIANGEYAGMKLTDYLGEKADDFPVLIKFIDAASDLSVQVHPDKNEMWYVAEAEEGAKIVYGLNGIYSTLKTANAIATGTLENFLNYTEAKKGDVFYIPSGLVHAIGKGLLIAEIQQTNDTTYRLYDYNRLGKDGKPRELHISKALETIRDFTDDNINKERYYYGCRDDNMIASSKYFTVFRYEFSGSKEFDPNGFLHILCLSGTGKIGDLEIFKGDSIFIPEGYGRFDIISDAGIDIITTVK